MTLCLAIATPHYGLVALDASSPVIFRLPGGFWMTGCGRVDVLGEVARQLEPCADPSSALAQIVAHVGSERLCRDPNADEQVRKTTTFVGYPNGAGCLARGVGCDGWDTGAHRGAIGNFPPGVSDEQSRAFIAALDGQVLNSDLGANPWAMVKRVAELALEVQRLARGSVYGMLEVGVHIGGVDYHLSRTSCHQLVRLAPEPIARRFQPLASLHPAVVCQFASRVIAVTILSGELVWRGDHLFALWTGDSKVRSVKVATSTTSQPAAGTGTVAEGNTGEYDAGAFTYTQSVYLTVTPYSGVGGTGVQGTPFYTRNKIMYIETLIDATSGKPLKSTAWNDQGAFLPFVSPSPGTFFSYASGGPASGQMWISFDWSSASLYRPDGTTATVPAPPAAPSAPTLSQTAGGALGARTRWAKVAYLKTDPITGHETLYPVSAESSFAISANNLLVVTALTDPGDGKYDGWAVLVGSASGSNYVQGTTAKQTFGVNWTEPAGGFSTTQNSLWTASWKKLTKIGLDPTTTYKHYPYYHIGLNFVYIPAETTNASPQLASLQNGDGVLSLGRYGSAAGYSGVIDIATPAAASTGSGNVGGGRLT